MNKKVLCSYRNLSCRILFGLLSNWSEEVLKKRSYFFFQIDTSSLIYLRQFAEYSDTGTVAVTKRELEGCAFCNWKTTGRALKSGRTPFSSLLPTNFPFPGF